MTMARGRQRAEWNQTAEILALLANMFRPKGVPPFVAKKLNPFIETKDRAKRKDSPAEVEMGWAQLRAALRRPEQ